MIYLDCLDSLVVSASQVVLGPTFPIKQHSHYLWLDAPWLLDSNFFQTKCHLQSHRSHPPISMCKLEEFSFNHQCLYATICPSVRHNVHIGKLSTRNPLFLCTEACFLISNSAVRENSTSFIKTGLLWWFSSCFTAAFLTNTYWSHTQHAFWLVKRILGQRNLSVHIIYIDLTHLLIHSPPYSCRRWYLGWIMGVTSGPSNHLTGTSVFHCNIRLVLIHGSIKWILLNILLLRIPFC